LEMRPDGRSNFERRRRGVEVRGKLRSIKKKCAREVVATEEKRPELGGGMGLILLWFKQKGKKKRGLALGGAWNLDRGGVCY